MEKSRDAFRTISEVAEWLDVPTHVLRFWESRFSQIKPVKRAGGRRYYRPSDMRVIGGVKTLLHDQGMTIRGVQKLFREQGIKHVSSHAPALYDEDPAADAKEAVVKPDIIDATPSEPAPSARSTRDAAPDPIIDETPIETEAAPVVEFSRTREAEPAKAPKVKLPNGIPATDPADDDASFGSGAGVAARLRSVPREKLSGHRDMLGDVVRKLKALHERAD